MKETKADFLKCGNKDNFFTSDSRISHSDRLVQREGRDYFLLVRKEGKPPQGSEA